MTFFDYSTLYRQLEDTELSPWLETLPNIIESNFNPSRWGDIPKWMQAWEQLPDLTPTLVNLNHPAIEVGIRADCNEAQQQTLKENLFTLHPWRKGPFDLFGIHIDTEWRSDLKWDRLQSHIEPLAGRTVLDVGCGSGYHCWRMRGAGASLVIGIEPTPLFIVQFQALQKYIQDDAVHVVPARMEEVPPKLEGFDSTFSMGILYHRRSPMDHLLELKDTLKPGGQLILETLVIEGKLGDTLVPEGRYGKMGNVWFIPSCDTLSGWLKKTGFKNIQCIDVSTTTPEEQRQTEWMTFQSLADFLDPEDSSRTIEGYPAPKRAVFIANK